jgi:hypothetical protein
LRVFEEIVGEGTSVPAVVNIWAFIRRNLSDDTKLKEGGELTATSVAKLKSFAIG